MISWVVSGGVLVEATTGMRPRKTASRARLRSLFTGVEAFIFRVLGHAPAQDPARRGRGPRKLLLVELRQGRRS